MIDLMKDIHPVSQALIATSFTWFGSAMGASLVFLVKGINRKLLDGMLGFAGGVMIAASYWSLLEPSIEMSQGMNVPKWLPPVTGFLAGAVFLRIVDMFLPHLHIGLPTDKAEGIKTSWRRTTLLILAVTLHNIPEGLAVGVAFGGVAADLPSVTASGAIALTVGMALQNFPEGIVVSMPLRREGLSRPKSFWYGQLSGAVEPIAGIIGAVAISVAEQVLPYALSFAAGAMIFVVVEELIPESQRGGNTDTATMGAILGFLVMMVLAIGL